MPYVVVLLVSALGVLGDFFLKRAGDGKKIDLPQFLIGMAIYATTAFGWYYVIKHIKLSAVGPLYAISTILMLTLVGTLVFKERLAPLEMIGIGMSLVAVILLSRFA